MRNRQPADQQMDPVYGRTLRTLTGSPAERLEPTRPPARPRRHRLDREQRRASPLLRVLSGLFTFALLLMLLVGGLSYLFDSQIDAPGPLARAKVVAIPKSEGAHEIATRLDVHHSTVRLILGTARAARDTHIPESRQTAALRA